MHLLVLVLISFVTLFWYTLSPLVWGLFKRGVWRSRKKQNLLPLTTPKRTTRLIAVLATLNQGGVSKRAETYHDSQTKSQGSCFFLGRAGNHTYNVGKTRDLQPSYLLQQCCTSVPD